jgi:hypothetical protein
MKNFASRTYSYHLEGCRQIAKIEIKPDIKRLFSELEEATIPNP